MHKQFYLFFSIIFFSLPIVSSNVCADSFDHNCEMSQSDVLDNDCSIRYCDEQPCQTECPTCCNKGHLLTIAPEFSYLKRKREGGTHQHGVIYGARINYDYIKRYNFYIGAQVYYGSGILHGESKNGNKLKSQWIDQQIEGNLGYTFQYKYFPFFSLTPFGGYGYFREVNKFKTPSPLPLKFITHFPYFSFGFLSSTNITPCLRMGLNARLRSMWDARCRVKDDPDFERIKLLVGNRIHFRIELPLIYCRPLVWNLLELGLMPFYEMRNYGDRENFPFDFFKTTVRLYGVDLQLIFRF